ncbi:uncharacterized protein AB675_10176 [Cyphellophora attinorum]|uniref:Uncharacterized protein n=1 Tax=Cyphellophora attinorum TaxID=1664694 RepID=A0A0N1NY65_9EURO|nr:uncharacterized protein AB675_10176 [Phialophora attinorum]KPI35180.1 hypothetical protein AB675_10176 [Phialophora attinorum]
MPTVKCKECGAGVDLTKDGLYGHCASCNNIIEFTPEELEEQKKGSSSDDSKSGNSTTKNDEADDESKPRKLAGDDNQ